MSLTSGIRLGPYEIVSAIGAGGMGEVYKACDSRLDRTVAIKVLPELMAADPQLRERFEREARTISQLTHPNVCTLHDVGQHEGVDYLVFEYLEGETLADRLKKGPLPIDQALKVAIDICDALDGAHRRGVIHRDLKPGNVMLVRGGAPESTVAKLLDFGLAKTTASALAVTGSSITPTQHAPLTQAGTILGTFQYMAPEQLEGREADARTDIFAFGAMLYEMVTGRTAFEGRSHISLLSAIMTADPPPMSTLRPLSPRRLERVVRTCLAKNPEDRWSSAHDLLLELQWLREGSEMDSAGATPTQTVRAKTFWLAAAAAVGLVVGASTVRFLDPAPAPAPAPLARFSMSLPDGQAFTRFGRNVVAFSPDGTRLVYVADSQLFLRTLDEADPVPIRGSEIDPIGPFFSPDGTWVAFYASGQLRKVPITGGAAVPLAALPAIYGASWAPDGIVVGQGPDGIARVAADGGQPETIVTFDSDAREHGDSPQMLPGGRAVLFTLRGGDSTWDDATGVVQELASGQRKVVVQGGRAVRYVPTGHLVYARQGTMFAVPFDLSRLEVAGGAVPLMENVASAFATGGMQWTVSDTGAVAYVSGAAADNRLLVWVDRSGAVRPVTDTKREFEDLALSPDGDRIAVTLITSPYSVWVQDVSRGTLSRLTFSGDRRDPIWTPDGKRIIYASSDTPALFWKAADGSGDEEQLLASKSSLGPGSVSPDGRLLVFEEAGDLWMVPLHGDRKPVPLVQGPAAEAEGRVSPDGRWLAYSSTETGRQEIYVRPFPDPGGKWQISTDGGQDPMWHPSGNELFFRSGDRVLTVAISRTPVFKAGVPRVVLRGQFLHTGIDSAYSAKGDRFAFIQPLLQTSTPEIRFVLNWFTELSRRVQPSR